MAALSAPDIHKPWMLSAEALKAASHTLRKSFCGPVVDPRQARTRALDASISLRRNTRH
ncbi:MAG: hypothetical protein GY877_07705 [Hyphomicrobium sp.]|nr:hypothetical protein [Hyphomicrobium sp.]